MGHRFDPKHVQKLDNPERRKMLPPYKILRLLDIKSTDDIADIGCGPGYFSIPAASMTKGVVYGVDVQPEMLDLLSSIASEIHISNIKTIESDAEQINLSDTSVDKIICSLMLHEVNDITKTINEFKRLLRPNGRVMIIEWEKKETESGPPVAERLDSQELQESVQSLGFQSEMIQPNPNQYILILRVNV